MDKSLKIENVNADTEQLELAHKAASGNRVARKTVNSLAHPIIRFQTNRFCRRFCRDNHFRYVCTLNDIRTTLPRDAILCEWGNASYAWMLDDLTNESRLLKYSGKNGARLNDYFYYIANSLPFYERWKDWRFGRKVHVPTYIKDLFPDAGRVFYCLRAGEKIPQIAQKLMKSVLDTEDMCQRVVVSLTQRKRLHLLDPPVTVSLSSSPVGDEDDVSVEGAQTDIPIYDEAPELAESKQKLGQAWRQLTAVEQFIIEAMVLDNQDAEDVLSALIKMDISIKNGVAARDTNRQQLYYFRRKVLAKLSDMMAQE